MPSDIIFMTSTLITAVGVIIGALYAIYKFIRRISDSLGLDRNGRTLAERLDRVEHQLWENGGGSLADRVNRIEASTKETATELRVIKEILIGMPSYAPIEEKPKTRRRAANKND